DDWGGGGGDCDPVALVAYEGKIGDAGDVDQPFRPGEPHGHEWDEGLPTGNDPRVVARGEHGASLVEIRGSRVFERCGFHRAARAFFSFPASREINREFVDSGPALPFFVAGKQVSSMSYCGNSLCSGAGNFRAHIREFFQGTGNFVEGANRWSPIVHEDRKSG